MNINSPQECLIAFFYEADIDRLFFHQFVSAIHFFYERRGEICEEGAACDKALKLAKFYISSGFSLQN